MDLTELLKFVTKKEASDLHLKPGRPPLLRVNGRLVPLKTDPLAPKEIEDMVLPILTPYQRDKLQQNYAVDIGYGITGVARFRGNIYLQRGTWTAVFRRIPYQIPQVAALNLPEVIETFADLPAGLVLVTGPTGSGKSTTLAAMIKLITERHPVHIVTIEDPIEYLFQDNMASVSQREMGTDTVSFPEALRNVMRQDPDVIMVGEMRDWETMSTAITAAETGHLVYSTLHTNSASQTIDRIMDSCPPAQQNQVRRQLALVLRAIISMQLIDRVDGKGLVPVVEILINSPKIAKQIETGETKEIGEEIETSRRVFQDAVDEPVAHRAPRERRDRRERRDEAVVRSRRPLPQAPEALPENRGARPRRNHVPIRERLFRHHRAHGREAPLRRAGGKMAPAHDREGRSSSRRSRLISRRGIG